ncbi:MAG: tetraacyldisaccharide 4'-kinase [Candidatus Wallbacteria bacterium]|nr:tetraacyldisaccharide 4'-kinase [Candidatus Wallbacteria bacterium]
MKKIASGLYFLGYLVDRMLHAFRPAAAPRPVISIGNLTAGGTGKTTLTCEVVEDLRKSGLRSVIIIRGYRARRSGNYQVFPDDDPVLCGDEAVLLALRTGTGVYAGVNRVKSIRKTRRNCPDCYVLDDGFQYYRLKRDLDILLLDAMQPSEDYHLLPSGLLREPFSALSRAGMVVISRSGEADKSWVAFLKSMVRTVRPDIPIFEAKTVVREWLDLNWKPVAPPLEVIACCGVGNPGSFRTLLERNGLVVTDFRIFPDHHDFTVSDLIGMLNTGKMVAVTEKDAVKLRRIVPDEQLPEVVFPRVGMELDRSFFDTVRDVAGMSLGGGM